MAIQPSVKELSSTYQITQLSYPEDVMSDEYGGNFAMFFINAQSESKLAMPVPGEDGVSDSAYAYSSANFVNNAVTGLNTGLQNISETEAAVAAGIQSAVIAGGGTALMGLFDSKGKTPEQIAAKAAARSENIATAVKAGAIAGTLTGVVGLGAGKFSAPVKRLKTAIALHMPTSLAIRYSANYEETEADNIFMASVNAAQGNIPGVIGAGTAAAMNMAPNSGILSKLSKTAPNPVKEQIFKSVDHRTFTFSYRFAPRDETEASNALNIIQQFKFHMYPEFKDDTGFLYIFPSEFDIVYYSGSNENTRIHKHTSCVLTEMNVNYTPNGSFTTFNNGMPTQIEIQLTFKELALLDKAKIQQGGF